MHPSFLIPLMAFASGAAPLSHPVELTPAGDWCVRVKTDHEERLFPVAPAPSVSRQDIFYTGLPAADKKPGFAKKGKLAGVRACECSVRYAIDPASVRVTGVDGRPFKVDADYLLDPGWGAVEAAVGSALTSTPVRVDYTYRLQRVDSIVRTATGALAYRAGVPRVDIPEMPRVSAGERRLANIWVNAGTRSLSDENLYPVLEPPPAVAPKGGEPVAAKGCPKTWAKLNAGGSVRVLAWGDSVTACGYLPNADKWQEQFLRRLRARFPKAKIELVSLGWGGRASHSFRNLPADHPYSYETKLLAAKPDLIVSEFVNDAGKNQALVDREYGAFRDDFRRIGADWIILTPHYTRWDWMNFKRLKGNDEDPRTYVKAVRAFGAANGIPVADAARRWGHLWREGVPYMTLFCNDINHPNAFGMSFFADALMGLFE